MKFVIVGAPKTENTQDLIHEIESKGHEVITVKPANFIFEANQDEFVISCENKNLLEYDIFLLRGYTIRLLETQILVEKLVSMGKTVIDETVGSMFFMSKMFEASRLTRVGLNYPKTYNISDYSSFKSIKHKIKYPVITKPTQGQKGQDIEKHDNEEQLKERLRQKSGGLLIQEFLPLDGDLRVFVVGREVLGAIKRHVVDGDFRSNASLGARAEKVEVTDEIREIALKATEAMNLEIAGVDLAQAHGKWFVLEVNFTPQWQKFKEVTGINPAGKIIDYAIKKMSEDKIKLKR